MKFEKKLIKINNLDYFYWIKNKKEKNVIILLHGFPGNHLGLIDLANNLDKNYQIIIPDLPACGKSDKFKEKHNLKKYADWLANFLDELYIDKAIIIGHSFGSRVALFFSAHYGKKVEKLILLTPIVKKDGIINYLVSLRYKFAKLLPYNLQKIYLAEKFYQYLSTIVVSKSSIKMQKKIIDRNIKELKKLDPSVQVQLFDEFYNLDLAKLGKKVKKECLIIAGDKDKVATLKSINGLVSKINVVSFEVIKNAGHLLPLENYLETSKIINNWIKSS